MLSFPSFSSTQSSGFSQSLFSLPSICFYRSVSPTKCSDFVSWLSTLFFTIRYLLIMWTSNVPYGHTPTPMRVCAAHSGVLRAVFANDKGVRFPAPLLFHQLKTLTQINRQHSPVITIYVSPLLATVPVPSSHLPHICLDLAASICLALSLPLFLSSISVPSISHPLPLLSSPFSPLPLFSIYISLPVFFAPISLDLTASLPHFCLLSPLSCSTPCFTSRHLPPLSPTVFFLHPLPLSYRISLSPFPSLHFLSPIPPAGLPFLPNLPSSALPCPLYLPPSPSLVFFSLSSLFFLPIILLLSARIDPHSLVCILLSFHLSAIGVSVASLLLVPVCLCLQME